MTDMVQTCHECCKLKHVDEFYPWQKICKPCAIRYTREMKDGRSEVCAKRAKRAKMMKRVVEKQERAEEIRQDRLNHRLHMNAILCEHYCCWLQVLVPTKKWDAVVV